MEKWKEQLIALRKLSEKLTLLERKRQQLKVINKTISLKTQLDAIEKKLKTSARTAGDIKKHMQLLTELPQLYGTDELKAPLNIIKKETELLSQLYNGLMQTYNAILIELSSET